MKVKPIANRIVGILLVLLAHPAVCPAAQALDRTLAPCLDDQTFAVIHLDVTRLDAGAWVKQIRILMDGPIGAEEEQEMQAELKNMQMQATTQIDSLIQAGAQHVFLVFSMYDFPYFFAAVPCGTNGDQLSQYLQNTIRTLSVGEIETHVSDGLVLAGLRRTITRLRNSTPVTSRALAAASAACPPAGVQAILCPSFDQRRVLMEMLPQITGNSAKGPWTTLGTDLRWLVLGFNGPPAMSLTAIGQSPDAEGAGRVVGCVQDLKVLLTQHPGVQQVIPQINQIFARFMLRTQGDRSILTLDAGALDPIMNDVLPPIQQRIRSKARRKACKNNLSNIGRGVLIYANDHADRLPPDLKTLNGMAGLTERALRCPSAKEAHSYVYRGGAASIADIPMLIVAHDRKNYHGNGRNVLFLDSHTEWVEEQRFQELIEEDNAYRRKKGLPVLALE